ncbi:alkaline phosphatase [Paracoccus sp. (in: a-proteobacteria)]|uniref:alkaline phosphatase n=1 Tax=Paracoccus sp. TaxID=267 RepID=UPI0026DF72B9|nr:alkaline phosphatase [Paracoccus sp. (in: a-proteobacteria)]MDO5646611.1 alkaline phosphatase [Paracoccus sp. (in: a-proteobacteria)]
MRLQLATAISLVLTGAAGAEVTIAQKESKWFTDAQAQLAELEQITHNTNRAKNIILFIADGNGVATNYATRLWMGQQEGGLGDDYVMSYEKFPHMALMKTYTSNGQTPDSAPTASAMNTGVKSRNGTINIDDAGDYRDCNAAAEHGLTTFAELMTADRDMKIGIVSTARLTHATPAAVYAKTAHRDWEDNSRLPENCAQKDIAAQMVDAIEEGRLHLALGGGRRHFLPTTVTDEEGTNGNRTDDRNLVQEIQDKGWQYVWNDETFAAADKSQPVLGLFEASHMKYENDRVGEPSLAEMTEFAINALDGAEGGYFLEIEAGRVDHANHAGNLHRVVTDGAAFADAIAKAAEMVDLNETLIIVTADHEHVLSFNGYCGRGTPITGLCFDVDDNGIEHTGTPSLALDGKPYTVAGYLNGPGSILTHEEGQNDWTGSRPEITQEQATDPDYLQQSLIPMSSETHSGVDVPLFAAGPWSHLFQGVMEQNLIFHVMMKAVHADES